MRRLAAIAIVLASCASLAQGGFADMLYASGQLRIRLLQIDCAIPDLVVALNLSGALTPPKAATVTLGSTDYEGCWALDADSDVLVADERGSRAYFPMSAFRPVEAVRPNWVRAPGDSSLAQTHGQERSIGHAPMSIKARPLSGA